MKYNLFIAHTLLHITAFAQEYNLTEKIVDKPEYTESFSSTTSFIWLNKKYDTAFKAGYYYENGKYVIEGEKGVGIYRSFADAAATGLKQKFVPYAYGNKYVQVDFTITQGGDTSSRYGLFMGQNNGTGYILLLRPNGRVQLLEQYFTGKGKETAERTIKDFTIFVVKKGINQLNRVRYEIGIDKSDSYKFVYKFYINETLVFSHTGGMLYGEDFMISKRGGNYRLEVDNLSFGTYSSQLRNTPWNLNGFNELAKIMMDESQNFNSKRTYLLRACEPYRNNHSRFYCEMNIGGKKYNTSVFVPDKEGARISYEVDNINPGEINDLVNTFISGLKNHMGISEFAPSYKNLNVYGFPFFTYGEFEVKRGVVLLSYESDLFIKERKFIKISIDYNKKPFVPLKVTRLNENFHSRIREIFNLCENFENYTGALIQQSDKGILGGTKFYKYTGPVISEISYQHFVRKTEKLYKDQYSMGTYIVDGNAAKAREEYTKWINYLSYAMGKDYLIVPLSYESTGKQLVTSAPVQSVAFRSKDIKDGKYVKLQLENGKLLLYFGFTELGNEYDNDYYEQIY
jgi:hypothetical protein